MPRLTHRTNLQSFLGMNITPSSTANWLSADDGNTQTNANPRTWDIKWFAILAGPLLFGTIILPLVTGPTLRWISQSYVKLRAFWRLGFVLSGIIYLILYYTLITETDTYGAMVLTALCDGPLEILAFYKLLAALRQRERRVTWGLFWVLSSLLLCLDFSPIFSDAESAQYVLWGAFGWMVLFAIFLVIFSREWAESRRRLLSDRSSRWSGSRLFSK